MKVARHVVAVAAFLATLGVGVDIVINGPHQPWWGEVAIGFTLGVMIFLGPLGLALLALDYAFLRRGRLEWISFIALALAGVLPPVLSYGLKVTSNSNWGLVLCPIWIAVLVHRIVLRLL